jgi:hypothetical protein
MAVSKVIRPVNIFELYIKASLHVALAVTAFAYVSVMELGLSPDYFLFGFIFSSTVLSYNLTKYITLATRDSISVSPLLKWIGIVTAGSFCVVLALLFYLPRDTIIAAAGLGILTIAYAIPISEGRKNLRNIYGIKIGVIALVWAGVTVGLPVLNHGMESLPTAGVVIEAVQRLLLVGILIIPFDIRDYRSDELTLGTLPQIIGVKETKILGLILLSGCLLLEGIQQPPLSGSFLIFGIIAVVAALMVRRSMVIQSAYFASFWVEGIPVAWAVLLILVYFF